MKKPTKTKSAPPPPPPPEARHYAFDDARPSDVLPHTPLAQRPAKPAEATHCEFKACNGCTIYQDAKNAGDFSSLRGSLTWGRMRYDNDFVRMGDPAFDNPASDELVLKPADHKGPPPPPKPKKQPRDPNAPKGEGVCAFIDNLVMQGGRKASDIAKLVVAKWPDRDLAATLSTVKVRPSHCKKKGLTPPPFVKE